jgi:hypothetical protein
MAPAREHQASQAIHAVGGSHVHDVTQVTGNLFQTFLAAPPALRDRIRLQEFRSLITERVRSFVGREFVRSAVRDLLMSSTFPSGYIMVRGEPGIGKTAVMCALANEGGYLHHFNIAPQNVRSSRVFLENICAQLIIRYGLNHPTLPPSAGEDSAFLSQLMAEAAGAADKPVVILVDAIDEAEDDAHDANRLFLPPTLPEGVYFIISSREQVDYRLLVDRRKDIHLRDDDPENLADIRLFIAGFLHKNEETMCDRIASWNVAADAFVEELVDRSQGNFMYLVHVLGDIRDGRITPDNIESIKKLPCGLQAYYQRNWRMMRSQDPSRFEQVFEPVLRFLAIVREPVTLDYLKDLTGLDPARIREVIGSWRQFLNETEESGKSLYRVYHLGFQDFLAEEGMGLKPFHERIAMRALEKIPGFLDGNLSTREA